MLKLCAFADEISEHTDRQVEVLQAQGIGAIELRRVNGRPLAELDEASAAQLAEYLRERAITVEVIASAVGKQPADRPSAEILDAFDHAVALARRCGAARVRVFSFLAPDTGGDDRWLHLAVGHLRAMTRRAEQAGVEVWLENEKDTYATSAARCRALFEAVGHPALRFVFDPANFEQCGERAYPDAYQTLSAWLAHVHVKDLDANGRIVAAGDGRVGWQALLEALRDDGYQGMLSLEPHLRTAERAGGFSGELEFARAAMALRALLATAAWPVVTRNEG